jgi:hypothetical protein
MAHEHTFSGIVALGENSHQFIVGNDQKGAHVILGHHFQGLIDRLLGSYGKNLVAASTPE